MSASEDLESSNMSALILRNVQLEADILFYLVHLLNILSLSLTSVSGLCHIKIDIKHLRDDPDQRHPEFSL